MFAGRTLVLATKHQKEQVLGPLFEEVLGVRVIVPEDLDTDLLGTFSGEKDREDDPLTTAKKKCDWALELSGADLALSSEGSFGSHPSLFFLPANEEWLFFSDRKNGWEIHIRHLSTETNYSHLEFDSWEQLENFAKQVQFPSHGLILRKAKKSLEGMSKGIVTWEALKEKAEQLLNAFGKGYAETDMRAHLNPTRMQVIREAGEKLLQKIQSLCPACQTPGFGVTNWESGLPCSWCGSPTRSILAEIRTCGHCSHQERVLFPKGKTEEDPMYCDRCNP
ncbi:DUF6671 family protein [Algoriphagus taiwanensis]|uniref:DUF6671 domain-containing protein n=1 Tax=Algoriphagus taiwanensis TaxID=1445656 RepID=A0ABQ6Q585_9BACT|nr:hypothetical protein Ataiwa_30580 [Algoriphagus taiwanensis]